MKPVEVGTLVFCSVPGFGAGKVEVVYFNSLWINYYNGAWGSYPRNETVFAILTPYYGILGELMLKSRTELSK